MMTVASAKEDLQQRKHKRAQMIGFADQAVSNSARVRATSEPAPRHESVSKRSRIHEKMIGFADRVDSMQAESGSTSQGIIHPPLHGASEPKIVQPYMAATGNVMIDQFQPWYFGIAFAFLFKYCTGMPDMYDFAERVRYRRTPDAPRVEPPLWVRIMSRRVESQIQRDWHFGFVSWNYLFRSTLNLTRTIFSYEREYND